MFDFNYNENVGFVPYVSVLKAQAEKAQEEFDELSGVVAEQGEAVAENTAAINGNSAAIVDESEARASADEALEAKIEELPKFKIEVVDELPEVGDTTTIYLLKVTDEEGNMYVEYVYSNGQWEELGPMFDLSIYATKEEMDEAFAGVYTKEEVDALIAPLAVKDDVDAALDLKANAADVDTALALKADADSVYTKDEADGLIAPLAVKDDVDAALALKVDAADVYTKDEADAKFLTEHQDISNLATKDELAAEANTRAEGVSSAFTAVGVVAAGLAGEVSAREQAIAELHEEIVTIPKFKIVIVDELPASGDNATIYLVPTGSESGNIYTEYVYVNDAWEEVGPEKLDLTDYAKTADVNAALALKADVADLEVLSGITENLVAEAESANEKIIGLAEANARQDEAIAGKTDKEINGTNGKALMFNEADGGGAKFEHSDGTWSFAGVNDGGEHGIAGQIYALKKNASDKFEGARIDVSTDGMFYTVGDAAAADRMVEANESAVKGEVEPKADKSYVDSEVYKLTTIVGDLGGAVTYELPNPAGKSFNALMSNNGTVKLTDDVESGRFGPGITAKNTTKLNLNGHDLTITGLTTSSTQPAIMSRGTENLTIYGKGTIDAGGGVCIEANGVDSVINLTGSTTVYRTNRSGGELIYCYAGTINITNGTFRNDGANTTYLLNCYDANYKADPKKANIIVSSTSKTSGPKFYDFNPADNSAEGEHTNFVAAGCEVVVSTVVEDEVEHTVYTVVKSAE